MPTLVCTSKKIKKTRKKEKFYYIVENKLIQENGLKKNKRTMLKSLGKVSKAQAYVELDRYNNTHQKNTDSPISFTNAVKLSREILKKEVGVNSKQRTFELFEYGIVKSESFFKNFKLKDIIHKDIENFKTNLLQKGLSNRSVNIVLVQFKKVFKIAINQQWIESIPNIQPLSQKKANKIDRLSQKEIQTVLSTCENKKVSFYIQFMLLTGMRPHEFHHLKWHHIYLEKSFIHIISDNKNKRGRKIPIPAPLNNIIVDWQQSIYNQSDYVAPYQRRDSINSLFTRLGKKCNIKVTSYKLRKTFASIMAEQGVDRGKLAEIMGNSIATGEKYYIDVQHQHLKEEMDVMANVMAGI